MIMPYDEASSNTLGQRSVMFSDLGGIRGWFAIETDQANRLIAVRRKT